MKPTYSNEIIAVCGDLTLRRTPYGMPEFFAIEHGLAATEYFDTIDEAAVRFHELAFGAKPSDPHVLSSATTGMS